MQKYAGGFDVRGKTDYETVEWIFSKPDSNEHKLLFHAYDANLWPLPDFSKWKDEEWKMKQIRKARDFTQGFTGEVWLDDVQIKTEG